VSMNTAHPTHPILLIVAIVTVPDLAHALLWWVITVAGMTVAPYLSILRGVRRGQYSDHMISNRKQRLVPLSFGPGCMVLAFVLLLVSGASHAMLATTVAVIFVLACWMVVTQQQRSLPFRCWLDGYGRQPGKRSATPDVRADLSSSRLRHHLSSGCYTLNPSEKTVAVVGTPELHVQAVRIILAVPPFSAIACAAAASVSGMMRSMGIVNLPSRTASA
jgi:hypothetical protein